MRLSYFLFLAILQRSASFTAGRSRDGMIRQCSCAETESCQKESLDDMASCYDGCTAHLETWSSSPSDLLPCFRANTLAPRLAEECTLKEHPDHCVSDNSTRFVRRVDAAEMLDIEVRLNPPYVIRFMPFFKRALDEFRVLHRFFHCARSCVHKRLAKCFEAKSCSVSLPHDDILDATVQRCSKSNVKISSSLYSLCSCLGVKNGVRALDGGVCGVIGNPSLASYV